MKSAFVERHKDLLERRPESKPNAGYPVRRRDARPSILFIELRVPALARGMGYGRSELIVRALLKVADVDIFAHYPNQEHRIPADFEYLNLAHGPGAELLEQQLSTRRYDVIHVCRPRAVSVYEKPLSAWKRGGGRVVYDTESIYAVREVAEDAQAESYAAIVNNDRFASLVEKELRPAQVADAIVAVTEVEAAILRQRLDRPVFTIGHYLPVRPPGRDPLARSGLLFVGSLWKAYGPNYESLVWFLDHVWPRIRAARPNESLRIAGFVGDDVNLEPLAREGVACLGPVPDLTGEFARARLFIAPTRFAAGVPFKVHEAFSYGLPTATSLLIAEQLAHDGDAGGVLASTVWDDGREFADACLRLLSDDRLWLEKQQAAIGYMEAFCAPPALDAAIEKAAGRTVASIQKSDLMLPLRDFKLQMVPVRHAAKEPSCRRQQILMVLHDVRCPQNVPDRPLAIHLLEQGGFERFQH
jgi:glycosyltransferase involved in cell wall biosynthesis